MVRIGIIGLGAFGYSFMLYLQETFNYHIYGTDISFEVRKTLKNKRKHPYFYEDNYIEDSVQIVNSSKELIHSSDVIIIAVSSHAFHYVLDDLKNSDLKNKYVVNFSKGFEKITGKTFCQRLKELKPESNYSAIYGGSIAHNLIKKEPLGMDVASNNKDTTKKIIKLLASENLKLYESNDLIGIELASALKNVVSLLAGIIKGMKYNTSTLTFFISRASKKIEEYALSQGAKSETFKSSSQAWGNDLWMSCMNKTRNFNFGYSLGQGTNFKILKQKFDDNNQLVEAISTIETLSEHNKIKRNIILEAAKNIIIENESPEKIMKKLLNDLG